MMLPKWEIVLTGMKSQFLQDDFFPRELNSKKNLKSGSHKR